MRKFKFHRSRCDSHSFPSEIIPYITYLKSIDGVENVGIGRFTGVGSGKRNNKSAMNIKYYNPTTRTFKLEVMARDSSTELFVRHVKGYQRDSIESKITEY